MPGSGHTTRNLLSRLLLASGAALAAAACSPVPGPAAAPAQPATTASVPRATPGGAGLPDGTGAPPALPDDACGAAGMQDLVGRPRSVLATLRLAGPVRVEEPGMMVTMDYRADRLRIVTDGPASNPRSRITRVLCG